MESNIIVCPKCGQTWNYRQGHFFCRPSKADVVGPILAELKRQGITYTMIANKLGVGRRAVGKWATGEENPGAERYAILQRLGTNPDNWSLKADG